MSAEEVDAAVRRAEHRRPDLRLAVQAAADGLTAGVGTELIHQAAVQHFLWWCLPRDYPADEWAGLAEGAGAVLDELGMARLAEIARSEQTHAVLAAWTKDPATAFATFRDAQTSSGVEPPDTAVLAWGSVFGSDEAGALDAVERALGDAISSGDFVPGGPRWRSKAAAITTQVLTRPLDLPPGQTLAGLVTTERVGWWIDSARHPLHQEWRSFVANRLLRPVEPPEDPVNAVAPVHWLLGLAAAAGGAVLTSSNYLARTTVVDAVERFGWWDWPKPPRSEADVHQLGVVREAMARLRLIRRRGRRLHATALGVELLADPARLWQLVATETEDGEDYTRMVSELVGLRLTQGRVERSELAANVHSILAAEGWSSGSGPITLDQASAAIWRPVRWWEMLGALEEERSVWERGTGRRLTPHTLGLRPNGPVTVLAFLRSRAAGPRHSMNG